MSKFVTLALVGAFASASWADIGVDDHEQHVEDTIHHSYAHRLPESEEGRHLANLLGLDSNRVPTEASNSLDEVAAAMLRENADYAGAHQDNDHEIPTFHVVHSGDSERESLQSTPLSLEQRERNQAAPVPAPPTPASSQSSESSESSASSSVSSTSSSDTSDVENSFKYLPYKPEQNKNDRRQEAQSSSELSSEEDGPNMIVPRQPVDSDSRHKYEAREKAELERELEIQRQFPEIADRDYHHLEPHHDQGYVPELDTYVPELYTQSDLDKIRDIKARLEHPRDRRQERERIEHEDVYTLTHQLDFAEQQLKDRLQHNLEMYHDLKKLRSKPHSEFTNKDFEFVKNAVLGEDGQGLAQGAFSSLSNLAAVAASICALSVYLF